MKEESNENESNYMFSKNINDYLNFYIRVADAKAAAFLAGDITIGTALVKSSFCTLSSIILGGVSALSISISILFGASIFIPSVNSGHKGFIFWENIKEWDSKEKYLSKVKGLSHSEIQEQYAKQNWEVSQILSGKHTSIKWGVVAFLVGFAAFIFSQLV